MLNSHKLSLEGKIREIAQSTSAGRLETDAVLKQLEKILRDPLFTNSTRYPGFLRYVVEQALAGRAEGLKERTIGIAVFHREADYDCNVDHIVRNVAVEVRKRLLQYYLRPEHEAEIRINLPAGAYVPEFHLPSEEVPPEGLKNGYPGITHKAESVVPIASLPGPKRGALRWLVAFTVGVIAMIGGLYFAQSFRSSAFDRFWAPVWNAPGPVVICVNGPAGAPGGSDDAGSTSPTLAEFERGWDLIPFSSASTLARVAELAGARGKPFRSVSGWSATYSELHSGGVILIGAGNSEWIDEVMKSRRFRPKYDGHVAAIVDSKNPNSTEYTVDLDLPAQQRTRDFAIVWRVHGRLRDNVLTGAVGLTRFGAVAAADFLTSRAQLDDFERRVGRGWEGKNLEILLTVTAVKGTTWPPLIIATEVSEPGSTNAFIREKSGRGQIDAGEPRE